MLRKGEIINRYIKYISQFSEKSRLHWASVKENNGLNAHDFEQI